MSRKSIADPIAFEAAVNNRAREIVETRTLFAASQQSAPVRFYDATEDMTVHELRMSIAAALHHADRTHKSRGCIGCEWCTLKALLEGYNADEDITKMRVWLAERQAAHEAAMAVRDAS